MLKEQKGITLVALVITIIVLLILAAVSIAALSGENGILSNASAAKKQTTRENAAERIRIALQAAKTEALAQTNTDNNFDPITDQDDIDALIEEAVLGVKDGGTEGTGEYAVTTAIKPAEGADTPGDTSDDVPAKGIITIKFDDNNNQIHIQGTITFSSANPSGLISTVDNYTPGA